MQYWNAASDLLVAIEYNDLSTAANILRRPNFDADIRFKIASNSNVPAICVCVERGSREMTRLLIDFGCSVNLRDDSGYTPLHLAVSHQFVDIINLLLNQRANVNCVSNYGHTPLHLAAQLSSVEAIESLVKAGAKLNCKDYEGRTPLSLACLSNQTNVAKYLIDIGANVNTVDNCLNTPLLFAINSGLSINTELIRCLLEANANANHVNVNGQSALLTTIRRSSDHCLNGVETVDALIEHRCDLNACDPSSFGENALHLSISRNQDRISETLIRSGCDLNRRNLCGHSVLYRLLKEQKLDLVALVLAAGIDWKYIVECCEDKNLIDSLPESHLKLLFLKKERLFPKLKHLSRIKIRQTLGYRCGRLIQKLSMPKTVEQYLLLNQLL